jgi:DUF1365 family protein
MNPVSFFFCYDPSGSRVEAIIAEVNNTPWGEQHVYVLPGQDSSLPHRDQRNVTAERIEKVFHVSPFMSLDMSYRMAFSIPGARLGVKIENHLDEPLNGVTKILDVSMLMTRKPLTARNLNWLLVKYPLVSFKIFAGIYWQALRLFFKKIPFFSHPGKPDSGPLGPACKHTAEAESNPSIASNPILNKQPESASESTSLSKPETALISQ